MDHNQFDVRYLLRVIGRRLPLFFVPFVLASIVSTIVVMALPAVYTADAKLVAESQQIPEDLVKSTITAQANERLQVIQQRVLTREHLLTLVDKYNLFPNRPDYTRSDIVDLLRKRIDFVPIDLEKGANSRRGDRVATAFAVQFNYELPDTAMKVANDLVTFIIEQDVKSRTEIASDTTKFLERETQRLSTELVKVQGDLSTFKLQNNDTLPEKLAFNMSLLEKTQANISQIDREIIANDEQQRLIRLEGSIAVDAPNGASSTTMDTLKQKLNEAKADYELKKATLSENHPDMKFLKGAIAGLQKQVDDQASSNQATGTISTGEARVQLIQAKTTSLEQQRSLLAEQRQKLEADADGLRSAIAKSPETGSALTELQRKEATLQKELDDMSARYNQAKLGERLEEDQHAERFQVIEQPILPQSPTKPNRPVLLAASYALSFALGAMIALAVEFLDTTIRRAADVERYLKHRPLVVVPYIKTHEDTTRGRMRAVTIIGFLAAAFAVAGLLFHLFIMPLDDFYFRLGDKISAWFQALSQRRY